MLGIIGAMAEEVEELKNEMGNPEVTTIAGMDFYRGIIEDKEAVVVQSGIGKVNAAICAQTLIDHFDINGIINTGVAGSLRPEINIGDLVLSTDAVQHDVDCRVFDYPIGQIPQMDVFAFPASPALRKQARSLCEEVNPDISVFEGRILSGDQFINDHERKEWLYSTFHGSCSEMEGAAIAQTAFRNHVPFLIIRAISDKADDSAAMDYSEFERQAIVHSVNLVMALIAGQDDIF